MWSKFWRLCLLLLNSLQQLITDITLLSPDWHRSLNAAFINLCTAYTVSHSAHCNRFLLLSLTGTCQCTRVYVCGAWRLWSAMYRGRADMLGDVWSCETMRSSSVYGTLPRRTLQHGLYASYYRSVASFELIEMCHVCCYHISIIMLTILALKW